jgi:hypothetical protein
LRSIAPRRMRQRLPTICHTHRAKLLAALVAIALGGCGSGEQSGTIGSRQWGPYDITVETRPWPPREGQNEVVVIIVGEHHVPIYDALVKMRAQPSSPWIQAIEDGHVGVYRRAVRFAADGQSNLQVQLQRGDENTVLDFPVTVATQR